MSDDDYGDDADEPYGWDGDYEDIGDVSDGLGSGDLWINDYGDIVDTETGEILGSVDDWEDWDDSTFWDDVADLNDAYA